MRLTNPCPVGVTLFCVERMLSLFLPRILASIFLSHVHPVSDYLVFLPEYRHLYTPIASPMLHKPLSAFPCFAFPFYYRFYYDVIHSDSFPSYSYYQPQDPPQFGSS